MGTLIQGIGSTEADYRGERFADHDRDLGGNNDLLNLTQPEIDPVDPPRLPRGRRRHRRDQHLQRHLDLAGRLRPRGPRLRDQPRGAPGSPARAVDEIGHPRAAALRRRLARPDQPHRLDLTGRQRPRRPQRALRRAGRGVPRAGQRPGRRRRRPPPRRDDLRHPQRQGGGVRARDALRGARTPLAGRHLRHHHRRLGPHAVGPGDRGVLELRAPRPPARRRPQLRPGCRRPAALRRRAERGSPTASSPCIPTPVCPTRSASTTRRPTTWPACSASSPRAGWSTSSAAAAAPRPSTSRRSARRSASTPRARPRAPARRCAWPASSRSPSTRTACSSTSASAPTSPARRSSAT